MLLPVNPTIASEFDQRMDYQWERRQGVSTWAGIYTGLQKVMFEVVRACRYCELFLHQLIYLLMFLDWCHRRYKGILLRSDSYVPSGCQFEDNKWCLCKARDQESY